MAYSSLLSLSLGFLILLNSCFAQIEHVTSRSTHQQSQQQRRQSKCQIQNLNALEPQRRVESEAGVTEFWDPNNEQLQCANVAVLRHTIQRRGLLVPSYNNAPQLIYVLQGRGIQGAVFPGCPETFQESQSETHQYTRERRHARESQQRERGDQHQKVRQFREGDVIALPAGIAHWIYNNGQSNLVLVSLVDVGNHANQLDQSFRKFFLAGSPQQEFQQGGSSQSPSRRDRQGQPNGNNIFSGFDERILAESFNVDTELVRRLQREDQQRGIIIRVQEELHLQMPQGQEEEREEDWSRRERERRDNGLEETFCTMRLRHNINNPSRADVFNPRGGRITSVNNYNLPILNYLQLSVEKGVLYRNAIMSPHWNINAHSVVYITKGNGRMQIVSEAGDTIFDDEIQEGQLVVVPQNFAVVKQASNQGLEWISFKTSENAKINQLAGRVSVIRSIPEEVLINSFGISRDEVRRLKDNRSEVTVFSPLDQSRSRRERD